VYKGGFMYISLLAHITNYSVVSRQYKMAVTHVFLHFKWHLHV